MRIDQGALLRRAAGAQGGNHPFMQGLGGQRRLGQAGVMGRLGDPGRMLEDAAEAGDEAIAVKAGKIAQGRCLSCQWRAMSMRRAGHTPSCDIT